MEPVDVPGGVVLFLRHLVKESCNCMREESDPLVGVVQCTEFNGCIGDNAKLGSEVVGHQRLLGGWGRGLS